MAIDFLVHNKGDMVGVVVVEGVPAGRELSGRLMETDTPLKIQTTTDIPLGHKVALMDIKNGDTVIEYAHDIGKAVAAIAKGAHVHVHNIKTKRW